MPTDRPAKPYPNFPLHAHSSGQWAKKIRGKRHYFGSWRVGEEGNWREALDAYQRVADDLHAGRTPRPRGDVDLEQLCNDFLYARLDDVETGEIKHPTYLQYKRAAARILAILGRRLDVESMEVQDFTRLRTELAKELTSPVTLQSEISRMRVIFGWATTSGLIKITLPYQKALKKPPVRLIRKARAEADKQLFTAKEIIGIIDQADGFMKPCVYLAINGGLGNRDCCDLTWQHVQGDYLVQPRPKNYIERRVWLWPETRKALAQWRAEQPPSQYVVCQPNGLPYAAKSDSTPQAHLFEELMTKKERRGRGFYAIRHTYRTIADETLDQVAIALTMGHADPSIAAMYREGVADARIRRVAEHVRSWLYRGVKKPPK